MKKLSLTLCLLSMTLCGLSRVAAQEAVKPFKGTIQYKITYESDLSAEELAQMPQSAEIKISDTKLLMSTEVAKAILNADENRAYNLLNLSRIGLGKYVIMETLDEMRDTGDVRNYVLKPTGEMKTIHGYMAKQAIGSYQTPQADMSFEIYYVEDFCPAFFNYVEGSFIGLEGFPLAYSVTMKNHMQDVTLKTVFTPESLQYGEIEPKTFNIPKTYQTVKEDELRQMVEEFMSAFE
ncbi:MAG: hypothetical protein K2G46_06550 [Bacteroidales bacterium]|nr:hypothetical protein [Bacteroidales bacterium]